MLNPRIFNGYGSTEGFWNTFLRPTDLPEMAGTAGRACIDDDVAVVRLFDDRLADAHETVAKDGTEIGEVIVRSPKGANAYFDAPEQERQKFRNGWLHIGDLATWDDKEFVTIVGRKDDMLLSGGENVHPVQIEEALGEHPSVTDSLVVGVSTTSGGRSSSRTSSPPHRSPPRTIWTTSAAGTRCCRSRSVTFFGEPSRLFTSTRVAPLSCRAPLTVPCVHVAVPMTAPSRKAARGVGGCRATCLIQLPMADEAVELARFRPG